MSLARSLLVLLLITAGGSAGAEVGGDNWPGFRGDGSGVASARGLPVHWSATENVAWKVEVPGAGFSSPIVWEGRVYLTSGEGLTRSVLCYQADSGALVWRRDLMLPTPVKLYGDTGPAPSTPVTDGRRVYACFEGLGLVALDMSGEVLWTTPLGTFNNIHSLASSPILYQDTVLLCCDQQAEGFLAAFDTATGAERWRTARNLGSHWSTPLLITHQGKAQVVVGARTVVGYAADTGEELWSCRGLSPNVVPSPVYAEGLVWASSGRNGPALAIDPGGRGDISETGVRMYCPVGGPYVPSPLVYPLMMLPGDDGQVRFLNARGEVRAEVRLRGHFFASPVGAEGRIYWTSQAGDTYVLDVTSLGAARPEVTVPAVNSLGEKCQASPAVSAGRLYLRTEKHLFCLAGTATPSAGAPARPALTFAELKQRFAEHPAAEGPDVAVRIEVVEAMAGLAEPEVVSFLAEATLKDPHWDVCEAAAKSLGRQGEAALGVLRSLAADNRPFIRIIAAQSLGKLADAEAVPDLVKQLERPDALTRVAALNALGAITEARPEIAGNTVAALVAGLRDAEAVVRAGAAEALGRARPPAGDQREEVLRALRGALADRSPLVAAAADRALAEGYQLPREEIMQDVTLYGAPRPAAVVRQLTAGPVRLKFQDGELRYLYVADREIVRRVYFAVRDSRWDTVMPEMEKVEIEEPAGGGFRVQMAARCRNDIADYSWTGEIAGTPEGKITFRVSGAANAEFRSPRIGLNVLFGSDALAGTAYETTDATGEVTPGVFPVPISRALLTGKWKALTYRTEEGLEVACRVTGADFGMEDQRNFGDSSYKAYSGLTYPYPQVPQGERQEETLELTVGGTLRTTPAAGPMRVLVGEAEPGVVVPRLLPQPAEGEPVGFLQINGKPEDYREARALRMSFNVAAHMPDEDTFMENLTALTAQVETVRALAPQAVLTVGPINFDSPYPRPAPDARREGRFATAWAAAAYLELMRAGIGEASFNAGGASEAVLQALGAQAGGSVLTTQRFGVEPLPVRAQGVLVQGERRLWLVNMTADAQPVLVGGLGEAESAALRRFVGTEPAGSAVTGEAEVVREVLRLELAPYEVCEVTLNPRP